MAESLRYILVAERCWAVHTDLADQECTRILVVLDSLSQDLDSCIEQGNLAEKVVEDNLADLCIVVDLAQLEALQILTDSNVNFKLEAL